ncbi:carnitine O-acetyltransferase-like [Ixodes scapularis]
MIAGLQQDQAQSEDGYALSDKLRMLFGTLESLVATVNFCTNYSRSELPASQTGQLLQPDACGKTPLDMSQYQRIFSVYRKPSITCDKLEFNTLHEKSGKHVVAIHNGQMFTFNAYDAQGVPHDESRILTQLIRVVEMSPAKNVGVDILTAEHRDVWAKMYASLGQSTARADAARKFFFSSPSPARALKNTCYPARARPAGRAGPGLSGRPEPVQCSTPLHVGTGLQSVGSKASVIFA